MVIFYKKDTFSSTRFLKSGDDESFLKTMSARVIILTLGCYCV